MTDVHSIAPAVAILRESADPLDVAMAKLLAEIHFACLETPTAVLAQAAACATVVNDVAATQDREDARRASFAPHHGATGHPGAAANAPAPLASVTPITGRQRPETHGDHGDAS